MPRAKKVRIKVAAELALLTLSDDTVKTGGMITLGEDFFATSFVGTWTILGSNDEGPIHGILAHGDYTDSEIGEWSDASPNDPDDKIANERNRRQCREAGQFVHNAADAAIQADGTKVYTRMGWSIGDGHTVDFGAINRSGAVLTTGAVLAIAGILHGRWQR